MLAGSKQAAGSEGAESPLCVSADLVVSKRTFCGSITSVLLQLAQWAFSHTALAANHQTG